VVDFLEYLIPVLEKISAALESIID